MDEQRDVIHGGVIMKNLIQNAKLKQCSRCVCACVCVCMCVCACVCACVCVCVYAHMCIRKLFTVIHTLDRCRVYIKGKPGSAEQFD